ncbi:BZ3500_MvSof-1268-A1-R1_Chr5-2g07952 [Microbotryum saponariae]|uniref:BZ3500_MvSof-1268-A1-R1_Chr5-2g07952 protein n=1 Tax=Microbotryum saponariae TaxID=289078 RepID=A0A2X0LFX2_9BASI|nr:BZ3500_MvSof-1268-A1-R1_Chr5-2g07952 [Microbotryum saponariae]SDA05821.1 BZ3501_MvSof-1269-A2-R1_Chr5-2g07774 [Microbotryum saponariae]
MPFEGLARSISQEHEAAAQLERRTSAKPSSRARTGTLTRPAVVAEGHDSTDSGDGGDGSTLNGHKSDLESGQKKKDDSEKQPLPPPSHDDDDEDEFLVTLKGREHLNPHTWSEVYRWCITAFAGLLVLNATFASSAPSNLIPSIITHYGVSKEVGILLISIFVAGYCVGPLVWGPLSERYGRKLVMIVAWVPYICFQVGCALSPNIGSLIIFRFLGGCFAAAPLTNSGGVIADLWGPDQRGDAMAIFSFMPFAGPALAPIISGYMEVTRTNFRWIFWVLTIFGGVCLGGILFFLPETYVPYLLHNEAKRLRKETGDERWHAPMDNKQETTKEVINRTILKPFRMAGELARPMLLLLTLYMSLVYGVIYLMFEAVPIIFQGNHGLNAGESGLIFLALLAGCVIGVLTYIFYFNIKYKQYHHSLEGKPVPVSPSSHIVCAMQSRLTALITPLSRQPEYRLVPLMCAAPFFAVSFFWLGWTAYPSINIASPILAIVLLGCTVLFIFLSIFNYLIDVYLMNAASALSFNTVCRSSFGASFPLFAGRQSFFSILYVLYLARTTDGVLLLLTLEMFRKLSIPGASSLLGGLAIVFIPAPFLLYKYGKKIRSMSKNAVVRPNED